MRAIERVPNRRRLAAPDGQTITFEINTSPEFFEAILTGAKPFGVYLDFDYEVGDVLNLIEYDARAKRYTGRSTTRLVTFVTRRDSGLKDDYVVLGFAPSPPPPTRPH